MPQIRIGELNVHYQQSGSGPDVVLIHAFTSNLAVWMLTNIIGALSQDFRVTMYDLRGHGITTATPSGYTSDRLAMDLLELHEALGLTPALVVGHSYGGVIGMHTAVLFPHMVKGIVLSDCYFPGLAHLEPAMPYAEPWQDLRTTFLKADIDLGATVDFARLFEVVAAIPAETQRMLSEALGPAGTRWLAQMRQLAQTDAGREAFRPAGLTAERLREVHQPVVALYDEFTPFAATREFLRSELPNCVVDTIPQAKHLAPVENSAEFNSRVASHLRRIVQSEIRAEPT